MDRNRRRAISLLGSVAVYGLAGCLGDHRELAEPEDRDDSNGSDDTVVSAGSADGDDGSERPPDNNEGVADNGTEESTDEDDLPELPESGVVAYVYHTSQAEAHDLQSGVRATNYSLR